MIFVDMTDIYCRILAKISNRLCARCKFSRSYGLWYIQSVPLATEPGVSLIILTPMKVLQRNLNRSTFVVLEMKRNVSLTCVKFRYNILISVKIIKEMPGSVASGTSCIFNFFAAAPHISQERSLPLTKTNYCQILP